MPTLPNTSMGLVHATTTSPPIQTAYLALWSYLCHNPGKMRVDYGLKLARIVLWAKPDMVVLAGWMHIVRGLFLEMNSNDDKSLVSTGPIPIVNIHLTLAGQFDGANAIQRGYKAFQHGEARCHGSLHHQVLIKKDELIEEHGKWLHRVEWEIIVEATRKVTNRFRLLLLEGTNLA
ncbi:hypothetical protein EDD17DRAFT_1889355 [Pisolithus thermaeus]|nr:hypothetical protein EV401DRAFT_2088427 [Pisolithus croceorrhizus]KAI6150049.1 hypothetical protein EDD17DRAFT_1889355 [Pisolithus thermaeus]